MSLTSAAPQPTLAWQFDGTTTDYMSGLSGVTTGSTTYEPAKFNNGIRISNLGGLTSNYVSWTTTNAFNIDTGTSIFCWIKFNDLSNLAQIQTFLGTGGTNVFKFQVGTNSFLQCQLQDSVSLKNVNMFVPIAGIWYHVGAVLSNGTLQTYKDGATSGSTSYVQTGITLSNSLRIGMAPNFSGFSVKDTTMDDLRIYGAALSAAQVQAVYRAQGMPSRGVFTSSVSGSGVPTDFAPNPATIPVATVSKNGPFSSEGSLSFSGTGIQVNASKFPFNWYTGFTVEAWVNYTNFTNTLAAGVAPQTLGVMQTTGNIDDWSFGANTSGQLRFYYYFTGQNAQLSSNTITAGTWTHICAQHDGTSFHMYINGVRCVGPVTITGAVSLSSSHSYFSFGQYFNSTGPTFKIADVRLVQGSNVYPVTGFTPPSSKLTTSPVGTTIFLMQVPLASGTGTFSNKV
jgi:hypothetical protein